MRCRACARLLERLSVARRCSALRSAFVGWQACKVHASLLLASAFPSYLIMPARDVVRAAYDVLASGLHAASLARVLARSQNSRTAGFEHLLLVSKCTPTLIRVQRQHTLHCLAPRLIVAPTSVPPPTSVCSLVISAPSTPSTRPIMHRIVTLLACTTALTPTRVRTRDAALTQTRVRTRVMSDGEILRRSAEVGPLVRAFSVGQRGRGSGVSTLNVAEASALKAATDELIAKRQKCDGSVIVAQKNRQLVGFALVNDDVLETVAVAVDERGRGVGAQLVGLATHFQTAASLITAWSSTTMWSPA